MKLHAISTSVTYLPTVGGSLRLCKQTESTCSTSGLNDKTSNHKNLARVWLGHHIAKQYEFSHGRHAWIRIPRVDV